MSQTLHFQIDASFVTNIARQWLWDENRPYEKCYELLHACLGGMPEEQKPQTILAILEGRKKLVGINTCELVDDNKNIRPISEYIKNLERQKAITLIKEDMRCRFAKYVDKWSTIKSSHRDVLMSEWKGQTIAPETYDECFKYYTTLNNDTLYDKLNTPTMCGLWLFENPQLVAECCDYDITMVNTDTFWENIYQKIKDEPGFELRNQGYLATKRIEALPDESIQSNIPKIEKKPIDEQPEYGSKEYMNYMYSTETSDDRLNYYIEPDNYEARLGIIAPNGSYYSCSFAGHNLKAWNLMITQPKLFGITIPENTRNYESLYQITSSDKALDEILKRGWCALRYQSSFGYYITYPETQRLTKEQINAIFDVIAKYDLPFNTQALINDID